jgi:hypothetical protein
LVVAVFYVDLIELKVFDHVGIGWLQYLVYAPMVAGVLYFPNPNHYLLHILILSAARHLVGQVMISLSRWPYLIRNHEIQRKGVTFEAVDHSSTW